MRRVLPALLLVLAGCPEEPPTVLTPPPAPPPPVARLVEARGTVLLTRDGGAGPTSAPNNLYAGDVLETKRGSRALLRSGRLEVELDEDTIFPLGKELKDITVTAGDVFLSSEDGGADFATALGKGSLAGRVRVGVRDGGLAFDVGFGQLLLEDEDGGTTTAKQGQRMRVGFGALQLEEVTDPAERLRLGLGALELVDDSPPPVKAIVEAGAPLLKKPGAARATPAPKSSTVEAGTQFQTPGASSLRFEAEGLALRVTGGGSGALGEPQRLGASTLVPVTLDKGAAALRLEGKGALQLGGQKPVNLTSAEGTAAVSSSKGSRRVDVVAGTFVLKAGDGPETQVPAGQSATVGPDGSVELKPLARPTVMVPAGRRSTVYNLGLKELGLRLPDRKVRVEVSAEPGFTSTLASGEAEDFVAVPVPPGKQLFWRYPDDKGGFVLGQARLRPEPAASRGGARGDVIAETGLKATVFYQGTVPPLTLTFAAVPNAKGYHLKVYEAGQLQKPVFEKRVDTTRALIESGALTEGSYVWFAAPVDANGRELQGGRMNQMELVFDNALTTLVIKSPQDGARASAEVVAAGTAPQGAKLSINGKPAPLDGAGRFNVPLGKVDTVVFSLTTDAGESFWVRRLRR